MTEQIAIQDFILKINVPFLYIYYAQQTGHLYVKYR